MPSETATWRLRAAWLGGALAFSVFGTGCVAKPRYDAALHDVAQSKQQMADFSARANEKNAHDEAEIKRLTDELAAAQRDLQAREQQLSASGVENHNLKARLDESAALNQKLRSELERLGKNVDDLVSEKGALSQSLTEVKGRLDALRRAEEAAETRAATLQRLVLQLKPLSDAGFVTVSLREARPVVTMPGAKVFDGAKAEPSPTGEALLKQVAIVLKTYPDRVFQVRAHTDPAPARGPKAPTGWDLSTARASEVLRRLIANGIRPQALSAAGYGEFDPVAANDTADNRAKNRRVEVVFMPKADEFVSVPASGH